MKIKRNLHNGGLYTVVEKDGSYYILDLAYTFDNGVECMVFPCDKKGHITDWGEVLVAYPKTVDEKTLIACVEEFLA